MPELQKVIDIVKAGGDSGIEAGLNMLSELKNARDGILDASGLARVQAVIEAEIKLVTKEIDAEIAALTKAIKAEAGSVEHTVKGDHLMAVYSQRITRHYNITKTEKSKEFPDCIPTPCVNNRIRRLLRQPFIYTSLPLSSK